MVDVRQIGDDLDADLGKGTCQLGLPRVLGKFASVKILRVDDGDGPPTSHSAIVTLLFDSSSFNLVESCSAHWQVQRRRR